MKFFVVYPSAVAASACPYRVCDEKGGEVTWANAFLDAQRLRQLSLRSLRAYAYDLLDFARWFEPLGRPLVEITESTLVNYVRHQLERDLKPTPQTVNHRLGVVRCCYRFHTGQDLPANQAYFLRPYRTRSPSAMAGPAVPSLGACASNQRARSLCRSQLKKWRSSGKASAPTGISPWWA